MSLSISTPPQTVTQTAAQSLVAPAWVVRALSLQLRAVSPRGGVIPMFVPVLSIIDQQTFSAFR